MKYLISFLLLAPLFTIAQYTLQGKVVNSKTQKGIPYATVGLVKKNTGTNANEDGQFIFTTNESTIGDTLLISCTGYLPFRIAAASFAGGEIMLKEDITELTDVVVTSRKDWQMTTLNEFSDSKGRGLSSSGSQTEVALHLQLPGNNGYLKGVKLSQGGMGSFSSEQTIFRLKIYGYDTLIKGPSEILYTQLVEVKSKVRSSTIEINLTQPQVYLPQKDFFIAIEWLKIPLNEMPLKSIVNGVEQHLLWYRPNINGPSKTTGSPEIWGKSYNNTWHKQWDAGVKALAIAATVKY